MKLTAKGRYAVMAMADLASFNKQQKPVSLNDISIRQSISLSFLEQLFLKLKNKDLVTSVRGNLGGYRLSKEPNKIYLSSIIEAVNEDIKTTKCKLKSKKGVLENQLNASPIIFGMGYHATLAIILHLLH